MKLLLSKQNLSQRDWITEVSISLYTLFWSVVTVSRKRSNSPVFEILSTEESDGSVPTFAEPNQCYIRAPCVD